MEELLEIAGTCLVIRVPVELDHYYAEQIRVKADRIIENQNIKSIVFDFEKTSFMDSSGIGVIMGRYKNLRYMGGTVMAINVNERIRRILTLAGLYKIIDIYEGLPQEKARR